MQKLIFNTNKYGEKLLIDIKTFDEIEFYDNKLKPDFYAIAVLEKAEGEIIINTKKILLNDNIILFTQPGHEVYIGNSIFKKGFFLFFVKEFIDTFFNDNLFLFKFNFFRHNLPEYFVTTKEMLSEILMSVSEIRNEILNLQDDSEHLLRSLLYYLLIKTNRLYSDTYKLNNSTVKNIYILKFQQLLENNICEKHNVNEYAYDLKISRTYLNKLVKNYFNKTANQVIREYLLAEAKRKIVYSKNDISQIAFDLNFSEASSFVRFFKKMTGTSPNKFRKEFSK